MQFLVLKNWQENNWKSLKWHCTFYSQWLCDRTTIEIQEHPEEPYYSIYPNPSNGTYLLSFKEDKAYEIRIYNNIGMFLKKKTIYKYDTIDLSAAPDGIYYIQIEGINTLKIIKQ